MPFLLLLFILVLPLAMVVLMPLSLIQRYRYGTSRRVARGWVATLNVAALVVSALLFVVSAAVSNIWVADALAYTLAGLGAGCLLGLLGLWFSRWETSAGTLRYTPNRWLVLFVTLVVTARVGYGFWRSWGAWQSGVGATSWLMASGVAGSLAAGAIVLGYYLTYWAGVRRRVKQYKSA